MKYFALILTALLPFAAQAYESPAANIRHSMHYEWLVHHNAAFRHARMRKECGPLRNDPGLFHDCIDSFYQ